MTEFKPGNRGFDPCIALAAARSAAAGHLCARADRQDGPPSGDDPCPDTGVARVGDLPRTGHLRRRGACSPRGPRAALPATSSCHPEEGAPAAGRHQEEIR
jgi:hypothetical protein